MGPERTTSGRGQPRGDGSHSRPSSDALIRIHRPGLSPRDATVKGQRARRWILGPGLGFLIAVAIIVGSVGAATVVLDFEEFQEGTHLTTQTDPLGVRFADEGVVVTTCSQGNPECSAAQSGENAVVTPEDSQAVRGAFGQPREPLVAVFAIPQEEVQLSLQDGAGLRGGHVATLTAYDGDGEVVAESNTRFETETGWHQLGVSTDAPAFTQVTLTLAAAQEPDNPHNIMVVDDLTFAVNEPPTASFTFDPAEPTVGEPVVFDASDSHDPDGEIVEYRWDFDDGRIVQVTENPQVTRTFREPGRHAVTLEVVDDNGATDRFTVEVIVRRRGLFGADLALAGTGGILGLVVLRKAYQRVDNNRRNEEQPPKAVIGHVPDEPAPGRPVLLYGTTSSASDARTRIASYRWKLGDHASVGPTFVHTFLEEGDHEVELRVVDTRGASDQTTETVTVEATGGELALDHAHPNAPGNDHENLREEYLVFRNIGDEVLELGHWTIHDAAEEEERVAPGAHTFTFPDEFALDPDETVTVHTGSAPPKATDAEPADGGRHLYWGSGRAIWHNEEDLIVVADDDDYPVLAVRYERTEEGQYELENVDEEVFDAWFASVVISGREGAPLVTVVPGAGLGVAVLGWAVGILLGIAFRRGLTGVLYSWTNLTAFLGLAMLSWGVTLSTGLFSPSIDPVVPLLLFVLSVLSTIVAAAAVGVRYVLSKIIEVAT